MKCSLPGLLALTLTLTTGASPVFREPEVILSESPSRESLRARLLEVARGAGDDQRTGAGEAYFYAGMCFEHASEPDSAIACYARAAALRGASDDRLALADALLMRGHEGDVEAALTLLQVAVPQMTAERDPAAPACRARLAWAEWLAGRGPQSLETFAPLEASLARQSVWGYRIARVHLESGDYRRALELALPLAVACRGQDEELKRLLERASEPVGGKERIIEAVQREIDQRDAVEGRLIAAMGGRRVRFAAPDGWALGAVAVPPAGGGRGRAAIVLCAPHDTLESYDTLTVALSRAGWAVLLLELRGSGWSAGPACSFPESWEGREDEMQSLSARDAREGLRALSLVAKVDTSRYLVVGVGPTAPIAVEAAERDRRVQALVLLSPLPAAVDRGLMRERIRRLQRPIFFSSAPEDYDQFFITDALYQAGDRARSRAADARAPGHGAWPFRHDPTAAPRLVAWLTEQAPAHGTGGARPGSPRPK